MLAESNADNLLIFRDGSRVVSHVGILRQTIRTCGVDLPAACIGAVCTDPEYRKAGLAGELMDLAIRRSIDAGDLIMPISGKRTLYVNRGATSLGPEIRLKIPIGSLADPPGGRAAKKGPAQAGTTNAAFTVCLYERADWQNVAALQAAQSVRYVWGDREPIVFERFLQLGGTCLLARRKDGTPAAALLFTVGHPMYGGPAGCGRVIEFVGDPQAIPALLAHAATCCNLEEVDWPVLATATPAIASELLDLGGTGKPEITRWTIVILNLTRLVEKLAPLAARTGLELAAKDGKPVRRYAGSVDRPGAAGPAGRTALSRPGHLERTPAEYARAAAHRLQRRLAGAAAALWHQLCIGERMHIYVDDNPFAVSDLAGKSLRQVAQEIRQDLTPRKRMLVAIYADGQLVPSGELENVLDAPAGKFERVDFQSAVPQTLAREVLLQARELVAEATPICQQAGEMLSAGQTARAMELLGNCFGVWNQVQESMSRSVELLGLDLSAMQVDGRRADEQLMEFVNQLRQVKDALENRDYVQLSDILQYELQDVAVRWQSLLDHVLEQIDKA